MSINLGIAEGLALDQVFGKEINPDPLLVISVRILAGRDPPAAGNPKDWDGAYMSLGRLPARSIAADWRNLPRLAALDLGFGLQHGADRRGVVIGVTAFER